MRSRPLELAGLLLLLVLAALWRFSALDWMEFKGDEAGALRLTLRIFETGEWPQVGLTNSVGIHNPPLFLYLLSVPMAVSMDAVWVTGALVGVLSVITVLWTFWLVRTRWGVVAAFSAAFLFACSPWAVLYARKIWAQDVLPIFCVALLHLLLRVQERPKTWWAAGVPVLLVLMWQVHFSAVALVPVVGVIAVWRFRNIRWTAVLLGLVVAAASLTPYLQYQKEHDWPDVQGLRAMASGKRSDGTLRPDKPPLSLAAFGHAADITGGTELSYVLCFSDPDRCPSRDRWEAQTSGVPAAVMRTAGVAGQALLWVGFLVALWGIGISIRNARRGERSGPDPNGGRLAVVLLWFLGVCLFFILVRLEKTHPFYFIILYPAGFILMGLAIDWVARQWTQRHLGRWLAGAVLALVLLGHGLTLGQFHTFVTTQGGTRGDYGVAYTHKWAAAQWIIQNGLSMDRVPYEVRTLVYITRNWGDAAVIQGTEQADDRLESRYARADVYNTFRVPHAERTPCPAGWRRFGPMIGCPKR